VSKAFGSAYEGATSVESVTAIAEALLESGAEELALGDTSGEATPLQVARMVEYAAALREGSPVAAPARHARSGARQHPGRHECRGNTFRCGDRRDRGIAVHAQQRRQSRDRGFSAHVRGNRGRDQYRRTFAIVSTISIPNAAPVVHGSLCEPLWPLLDADHPENGVLIPRRSQRAGSAPIRCARSSTACATSLRRARRGAGCPTICRLGRSSISRPSAGCGPALRRNTRQPSSRRLYMHHAQTGRSTRYRSLTASRKASRFRLRNS